MTDAEPISEVTWAEWKQAQAHLKEMGVTFSLTGPDADAALAEIERLRNERAEALVECLHRGQEIKRLRSQPNEGPILTALLRDYAHWLNNKGYADFHRLEGTWNEFLAAERTQQGTPDRAYALIRLYIDEQPQESTDARLKDSGVPVWAIVGHWKASGRSVTTASADYQIPEVQIEAALAYYDEHEQEIEARIAANAA